MTEPCAKVICDSISEAGDRLTTMEVVMHRFVLAEFNTHRVFSRNSASSRAIPVRKQLDRVANDPCYPVAWTSERPGMQGGAEIDEHDQKQAAYLWDSCRGMALSAAERLSELGVHKSIANRLLEPFMWHTVIVSSTDWDNFFGLRCNPMAQPEIRVAAEAMQEAYKGSSPVVIKDGGWHTPYVDPSDWGDLTEGEDLMVSAARCARVSYLTHDGVVDIDKDKELFERLTSADPPHASPLEHVATPCPWDRSLHRHAGNFTGWDQLRHHRVPA